MIAATGTNNITDSILQYELSNVCPQTLKTSKIFLFVYFASHGVIFSALFTKVEPVYLVNGFLRSYNYLSCYVIAECLVL